MFGQCAHCDVLTLRDVLSNDHEIPDHKGSYMCKPCIDKFECKNIIKAHDCKEYPKPLFNKIVRSRMYNEDGSSFNIFTPSRIRIELKITPARLFGAEAEMEFIKNSKMSRAKHAQAVQKALGKEFVTIKHDGSLSGTTGSQGPGTGGDYGFEAVTAPCDMPTHRKYWPKIVTAEGYKWLRSWDEPRCGFHVHVTRTALTLLQIGRILMFINHPNNRRFVQKLAGRSEEKYCKYFDKKPSDSLHPDSGDFNERRRVAVNLQNPATIEFRIFRGTINPKHIIRNLEICDALCDFCHPASRSFNETIDPANFIKFVEHERESVVLGDQAITVKKWPILHAWFVFQGAIAAPKPQKEEKVVSDVRELIGEDDVKDLHIEPLEKVNYSIGIKA